jgi:hypothetical protein
MTNASQPKPNPVPAILVYGTPSGPALTQASWFRVEDKEAVKAAAAALKFSVIELQTDTDRALAAGAHEGVLKGSGGHLIVGSVSPGGLSADRGTRPQRSGRSRSVQAGDRRSGDDESRCRTKREHHRCWCDHGWTVSCNLGRAGDRQAGQRPRSRNPSHRREGACRLLERQARIRRLLARHHQADRPRRVHARVVRQPGIPGVQEPAPGHRRSTSRVSRLGQVTRNSVLPNSMGRPAGRPSSFCACPGTRRAPPTLNIRKLKP